MKWCGEVRIKVVRDPINAAIRDLMKAYVKYPPRKLQSETYTGPITITDYEKFQNIREMLAKEGVRITMPTGN
jgi:hypothetical protein